MLINRQLVALKRGQLVFGRKSYAIKTGVSENTIRTFLKLLKESNMINQQIFNKYSIITIINYDIYQQTDQQKTVTPPEDRQQTASKPPQLRNKEVKEVKEIKKKTIAQSQASFTLDNKQTNIFITLPLNDKTDFEVDLNYINELTELYPAIDVKQEFRNMKGWCMGNTGRLKTRNGIKRFINTWLSKEQNKGYNKPKPADDNKPLMEPFPRDK